MTDDSIEAKALALVNEVSDKHTDAESIYEVHRSVDLRAALCRAIEQHEAFKQEVSDVAAMMLTEPSIKPSVQWALTKFIIPKPKPDPLLDIVEWLGGPVWGTREEYVKEIHAALEARGWEIREKGQ
jgi:hypothetical protein